MIVKLLTEHHIEFLSLNGGCTGSYESTHVKKLIVGNLMSRLICAGSPEHSALDSTISTTMPCAGSKGDVSATYADSENAGESHLRSLSLCNSILISCAGSHGDLCAI